jgi:hypothetical protein
LAGDDECSGTWCFGAAAEESAGNEDQDDERKGCQQIDVSGIVTPVADFPAH